MVAVAYERWSFTRGLVFLIGGRLREVVVHGGSTVLESVVYFNSDTNTTLTFACYRKP